MQAREKLSRPVRFGPYLFQLQDVIPVACSSTTGNTKCSPQEFVKAVVDLLARILSWLSAHLFVLQHTPNPKPAFLHRSVPR